ncbi:hypothetical protein ES332_D12G093300v1 [Gossypium tomentosum]|uniref:Uncharacterized protein n=1 Tax=Gossypium tomentosum TaxID=34277 RepID=A0A5D2I6Y6_GOSTO|nr:hypothetical protein ES332_D12G093300v1 [Gossypium tomentosum]TYH38188.1 hypothetical protein ES332_D12G093300v1 [Gossypium tomentosum]
MSYTFPFPFSKKPRYQPQVRRRSRVHDLHQDPDCDEEGQRSDGFRKQGTAVRRVNVAQRVETWYGCCDAGSRNLLGFLAPVLRFGLSGRKVLG